MKQDFQDEFRKLTGRAPLNYNENPQVVFFNVSPSKGCHAAAKKLIQAGFNAYVGLESVIICELFNVLNKDTEINPLTH